MIARQPFGFLPDGRQVEAFTLRNPSGIEVRAITWGGTITSLAVPDRRGVVADIVLGYDDLQPYLTSSPYFGCIVGRFANRIAGGRFSLDGKLVELSVNDGRNHLHGGRCGFDKRLWAADSVETRDGGAVRFSRISDDGEEGYPGRVRASVQYLLTPGGDLRIDYAAETDATTIVNLTQHSYFNLAGGLAADVLDHRLVINADAFTPVTAELLPTGEIAPVDGTAFDFRHAAPIGARISDADEQLHNGLGFDHNWVLRRRHALTHAATLTDPMSGRVLEILTTAPGIQFYSGNQLDGSLIGKRGKRYVRHAGLCLETQLFPDAPNHPHFPSALLRPGSAFRSQTVFRFSSLGA